MASLPFGFSSLPRSSFRPTRNLKIRFSADRQALFNRIAPVYDNLNDLLSLGQHRIWKRMAVSWSGAKEGDDVLDICCGSGDLTFLLSERVGPHGKAAGLDFSNEQLLIASTRQKLRSKACYKNIKWMEGNALDLPFPDSSFDAVTIGYGLRNVVDRHRAMAEICRVLKPGSTVSVLDFNKSINPLSTTIQNLHNKLFCGKLLRGRLVGGIRITNFMVGQGYTQSQHDNCVYFQKSSNGSFIYLLLYVDDMLIASKDMSLIKKLKSQLSNEFEMKDLGAAKKILGMEISRERQAGKLYLSQKTYVQKILDKFNMSKSKSVSTPLAAHFKISSEFCPKTEEEIEIMSNVPYSSAVGSLMYAMV
ncbi:2-phytyl-1,4-naphtoquinone methyltransferase [Capsicum annuum]|nr:2-phytyl-1,4-naphtoquinone methyltransferase [Capsicum annuum]